MVASNVFYYETEIDWQREKTGQLSSEGLPSFTVGAPPEFKGNAGQWTPEHLLVASVNSCFMLTFLVIAENSQIAILSFSSGAEGKLEKVEGAGYQMTEIVLKPRVVIECAQDLHRTTKVLEKAKANCFVTNSIKTAVKIEPQVFHRQIQTSPCPLGEASAVID
ncbi:MAG TPA: OsmC family protein [Candidatus Acidoferrales bacterium]|nr:OsmC family protein [Candidatus Acidoferrales bacterium]